MQKMDIDEAFYDADYFFYMENRIWTGAHGERLRDIMAFVRKQPGRILDYGAGSGYFSWRAHRMGHDVLAWDYSESSRKFIRDHYPDVLVADQVDHISGSFDQIFLFDVIEHVAYERQAPLLEDLRHKLVSGGSIILSTDNVTSWFGRGIGARLQSFDSRISFQGRAYNLIKRSEHKRPYYHRYQDSHIGLLDECGIQELANRSGFDVKRIQHGFFFASLFSSIVAFLFRLRPLHSVYLLQRKD